MLSKHYKRLFSLHSSKSTYWALAYQSLRRLKVFKSLQHWIFKTQKDIVLKSKKHLRKYFGKVPLRSFSFATYWIRYKEKSLQSMKFLLESNIKFRSQIAAACSHKSQFKVNWEQIRLAIYYKLLHSLLIITRNLSFQCKKAKMGTFFIAFMLLCLPPQKNSFSGWKPTKTETVLSYLLSLLTLLPLFLECLLNTQQNKSCAIELNIKK